MNNVHARSKRQKELQRADCRQAKFERRTARRAIKAERLGITFGDPAGFTPPQDAIGWEPPRAMAEPPTPLLDENELVDKDVQPSN